MNVIGRLIPFIVIIILGIVPYSGTLQHSFHYDDYISIVEEPTVHWDSLSIENLKKLFAPGFARPVSNLTFALNYYFGGLDVFGFHVVNLLIHILTAIGCYLFFKNLFSLNRFKEGFQGKGDIVALVAALLWVTNPVQAQAVTYIVQRAASIAAMFYIYSIFFYLKGRVCSGRNSYLFYVLSMISGLLALGSKENAYTLPLCLLLLEIIVIRDNVWNIKKAKLALSAGALAFIGILWYLYHVPFAIQPGGWLVYQIKVRLLTGIRVIAFYIMQLLFPVPARLSIEHDFHLSRTLFYPPSTPFIVLAFGGFLIYSLVSFKRRPLFSFFLLWFMGNLALETFMPGLMLIFEHRLYLPSMGFFALVSIWIYYICAPRGGWGLKWLSISALLILFFSVNTYIRNIDWKDEYSLWSDVVKKSPNLASGYLGVGSAYARDENYSEAVSYYLKAKSLEPRNVAILYNLGVAYFKLKSFDDAIREFSAVGSTGFTGIGNELSISYYFSRIAKNYYGHGRVKEALELLDRALLYDPNEPMLKELKEKMEKGTISFEEIMRK